MIPSGTRSKDRPGWGPDSRRLRRCPGPRGEFHGQGPDSGGKILTGDMWQLHSKLDDDSVDLFLTDPPYADLECYSKLAELAADKLKNGGLCLAYSGQYHLLKIMNLMNLST